MYRSLVPKATTQRQTWSNLSSIEKDYEDYQKGLNRQLSYSYDIYRANEIQLQAMIDSFSLGELYQSLPVYYKGAEEDYTGVPYSPLIDKVAFMRRFLDIMLRQRKNIGISAVFDVALSVLGEQQRRFGIFQNFVFTRQSTGEEVIVKKLMYTNIPIPEQWRISPRGADTVVVAGGTLYIPVGDIPTGGVTIWTYYNNILRTVVDDGAGNLIGDVGAGVNTINYTTGAINVTFDFADIGGVSDTSVWIMYDYDSIDYLLAAGFAAIGYTYKDLKYPYVGITGSAVPSETIPPDGADTTYSPDNAAGYYTPTQTMVLEMFTESGAIATSTELLIAIRRIFSFMKCTHVLLEDFGPIVSLSTENSFFNINWSSRDYPIVKYPNQGFPNGLYPDDDHSLEDALKDSEGDLMPIQEGEHFVQHPVFHQPGPVPELETDGTWPKTSVASYRQERLDTTRDNDFNPCVGGFFYVGNPGPFGPTFNPWYYLDNGFGSQGKSYIDDGLLPDE
jgi:hypothetical protein